MGGGMHILAFHHLLYSTYCMTNALQYLASGARVWKLSIFHGLNLPVNPKDYMRRMDIKNGTYEKNLILVITFTYNSKHIPPSYFSNLTHELML